MGHDKQHSLHDATDHSNTDDLDRDITWDIWNYGAVLPSGEYEGVVEVPFDCTIVSAALFADQAGNLVIDIWRTTYALYQPGVHPVNGDSITAAAPPTLAAAYKSVDSTLTGWSKAMTKGDLLKINVDSVASITWALLALRVVPS